MKVKVSFTVEIDPEAWRANYGIYGITHIREDVKAFAEQIVVEKFRQVGLVEEDED